MQRRLQLAQRFVLLSWLYVVWLTGQAVLHIVQPFRSHDLHAQHTGWLFAFARLHQEVSRG